MLIRMPRTSGTIDSDTHRALKRIARDEDITVGEAVRLAVRRYNQVRRGSELAQPIPPDEVSWLDPDLR